MSDLRQAEVTSLDPTAGQVNSLAERRAAAHRRNVEQQRYIAEAVEAAPVAEMKRLTAKEYAYASGIKLLEPLVNRVEELEVMLAWVRVELVRLSAPKV